MNREHRALMNAYDNLCNFGSDKEIKKDFTYDEESGDTIYPIAILYEHTIVPDNDGIISNQNVVVSLDAYKDNKCEFKISNTKDGGEGVIVSRGLELSLNNTVKLNELVEILERKIEKCNG